MKIDYSFKRSCCSGWTIGDEVTIFLRNQYTMDDVIGTVIHEEIHAIIDKTNGKTTSKQDHWAIQNMYLN